MSFMEGTLLVATGVGCLLIVLFLIYVFFSIYWTLKHNDVEMNSFLSRFYGDVKMIWAIIVEKYWNLVIDNPFGGWRRLWIFGCVDMVVLVDVVMMADNQWAYKNLGLVIYVILISVGWWIFENRRSHIREIVQRRIKTNEFYKLKEETQIGKDSLSLISFLESLRSLVLYGAVYLFSLEIGLKEIWDDFFCNVDMKEFFMFLFAMMGLARLIFFIYPNYVYYSMMTVALEYEKDLRSKKREHCILVWKKLRR